MKKLILLFSIVMMGSSTLLSQEKCGFNYLQNFTRNLDSNRFDENKNSFIKRWVYANTYTNKYEQRLFDNGNALQYDSTCKPTYYVIPIVVHVIHNDGTSVGVDENISKIQIENAIDELNKFFNQESSNQKVDINFCLSKVGPNNDGIYRHSNSSTNLKLSQDQPYLRSLEQTNPNALNVFIVNSIAETPQGDSNAIIGVGTTPITDYIFNGVIVQYEFMGNYNSCSSCNLSSQSYGHTLTHEVGHFFGLEHTFYGACSETLINAADNCKMAGDYCCDTPPQTSQSQSCGDKKNCDPNEVEDNINNVMNYAPESCVNKLTQDQVALMYFNLQNYRVNLIQTGSNVTNCCYISPLSTINNRSFCDSIDDLTITAFDYSGAAYSHIYTVYDTINNNWVDTIIESNQNITTLNNRSWSKDSSIYEIYHSLIINGDTFIELVPKIISLENCGEAIYDYRANWTFGRAQHLEFRAKKPRVTDLITSALSDQLKMPNGQFHGYEIGSTMSNDSGKFLFAIGSEYNGVFNNLGNIDLGLLCNDSLSFSHTAKSRNNPFLMDGHCKSNVLLSNPMKSNSYISITPKKDGDSSSLYYRVISKLGQHYEIVGDANIPVQLPTYYQCRDANNAPIFSEGLTAIPSYNDSFYWLITVGSTPYALSDYSTLRYADSIYIFKVLTDTLVFEKSTKIRNNFVTYSNRVKSNTEGDLLIIDDTMYRFNNKIATLESYHCVNTDAIYIPIAGNFIGGVTGGDLELNTNSEFAYEVTNVVGFTSPDTFFQLDLRSKNPWITRRVMATPSPRTYGDPTYAPDNRIYITEYRTNRLSAIENIDLPFIGQANSNGAKVDLDFLRLNDISWINPPQSSPLIDGLVSVNKGFRYKYDSCNSIELFSKTFDYDSIKWLVNSTEVASGVDKTIALLDSGLNVISLVIDGNTFTDSIFNDFVVPRVAGEDNFCANGGTLTYTSSYSNSDLKHNWSVQNGDGELINNQYLINFTSSPATVYLTSTDLRRNCVYVDSLQVLVLDSITNNTITPLTNTYCKGDSINVWGSSPGGSVGNYTYQWQYSQDGNNWINILKYTMSITNGFEAEADSYYVKRRVTSDVCLSESNIPVIKNKITKNKIRINNNPCLFNSTIEIRNDSFETSEANYLYGYQITYDTSGSTGWQNLNQYSSSSTTKLYSFDTSIDANSTYLIRRYITAGYCTSYSDEIIIIPTVYFIEQPRNSYICNSQGVRGSYNFYSSVKVNNPNNLNISYGWPSLYGSEGEGLWSYTRQDSVLSGSFYANNFGNETLYKRCEITIPGCGTLYSNIFNIYVMTMADSLIFTEHPIDLLLNEDDSAYLNARVEDPSNLGSPTGYNILNWEVATEYSDKRRINNLIDFNYILQDSSILTADSLLVYGQYTTDSSRHFRALANNGCHFISSDWAMLSNRNFDIYMKDQPEDDGSEPNLEAVNNFTHSYDIWAGNDTNITQPTGWGEIDNVVYSDDTTYIRVRVRNRSNKTSKLSYLHLYWTNASTAEWWTTNWTKNINNRRWNPDSMRYYYEGGLINHDPIEIPPIDSGESKVITFVWPPKGPNSDTIPKTEWFHFLYPGTNVRNYDTAKWICLLARISHCPIDQGANCDIHEIGTSFRERYNQNIGYNVIYNNNIVSTNIRRTYIDPPIDGIAIKVDKPRNFVRVRSMRDTVHDVRWKYFSRNNKYDQIGEAYLHFDSIFWQTWTGQGSPGSGFTQVQSGILKMTNPDSVVIGPISIQSDWNATAAFTHHLKSNGAPSNGDTMYGFTFVQEQVYPEILMDGAVSLVFDAPMVVDGQGNDDFEIEDPPSDLDGLNKDKLRLRSSIESIGNADGNRSELIDKAIIYPNPSSGNLFVQLETTNDSKISIWITDLNGKVVGVAVINALINKGNSLVSIDGSTLAAGTYVINISGLTQQPLKRKITLINQ